MSLTLFLVCGVILQTVASLESHAHAKTTWPVPPKKYPSRPSDGEPYCQAGGTPFCPAGIQNNTMPTVKDTDELYVYAMKAPVWELKLQKFHFFHDAVGFHHVQSGLNLTMEWNQFFHQFNSTFPHLVHNGLKWCNQGAACVSPGIDADHWTKDGGSLVRVATVNGSVFNQFSQWTETDNDTYPFYETWTVRERSGKAWFDAVDGAAFVIRAFRAMHSFGAEFDSRVKLRYSRVELISKQPLFFATAASAAKNKLELAVLEKFYSHFQHLDNVQALVAYLLGFLALDRKFYLYFNEDYYLLPLEFPFLRFTNDVMQLPGAM